MYAILKIDLPSENFIGLNQEKSRTRESILSVATRLLPRYTAVEELGESAWLIPLEAGLPFLSELTYVAHKLSFSYKTKFLVQMPDWCIYPPSAKP